MGFALAARLRFGNDNLRLISVFSGDLTVRCHDLCRGEDLLAVTGIVRCDLSCLWPRKAAPRNCFDNLLPAWAGGVKVFLGVALNIRRATPSRLDLITEIPKLIREVGLVHGGRELLRLQETARLQGAHGSIFAFGHIEDDRMGMKLRSGVSVDGASSVMLKRRDDKLPRGLRRVVAADAGLGIVLQLVQSKCH